MNKDTNVFLKHILDSIGYVKEYTKGKSEEEFLGSVETQDAVIRRLSVIGEASKNIHLDLRGKHSQIDWRAIVGLKNVLVHEYFGVDMKVIWQIAKHDIPYLESEILKMLNET